MRLLLTMLFITICNTAAADSISIYGSKHFGTVIVIPIEEQLQVTTNLIFAVGAAEDSGSEGLAHFAEHRAFAGAMLASDYRGSIIAFTTRKITEFTDTTDLGSLPYILRFFQEILSNHPIPDDAFEKERRKIIIEIENNARSSVSGEEFCAALSILYEDPPWTNCVLGKRETIESLSTSTVSDFQEAHYISEKAVLVISGPVNINDVQRLVPPIGDPSWSGTSLEDPKFRNIGPTISSKSLNRLVVGYQIIEIKRESLPLEKTALLLFTDFWHLQELRLSLTKELTGKTYITRNFNLHIQQIGESFALVAITAELERGMTSEQVRYGIKAAIEKMNTPDLSTTSAYLKDFTTEATQKLVYTQILLEHLRNRHAPIDMASLGEAINTLRLDEINALNSAILTPDAWRFVMPD